MNEAVDSRNPDSVSSNNMYLGRSEAYEITATKVSWKNQSFVFVDLDIETMN